ncbi:MAG: 4a-hydroxytetrahydrobiopterin dehydratase [Verrucomicrobiales bacterium]|nr:4a-hydroxytetrahydrobiopterin dehydratase [Verrucomicrobiales bacterium]
MSEVIGENEMDVWMKRVPEWEVESESIIRVVEYDDFMDAIDFVNGVAEIAEEAQHYPEINVQGSLVTLRLTSEDQGGVTSLDFELAGRIDHLLD